jgi:hypothetical protein
MEQRNIKNDPEPLDVSRASKSRDSMDMVKRNMLMKEIYDEELSTRPNPVDLSTSNVFNRTIDNKNVFQAFMGQYWEDLPKNISSSQVVDEIIATFQRK